MRNRGWALVLVAVLLAMAATPVLADRASNGPGEMQIKPVEQYRWRTSNTIFSLVGAVTAVGEDSITVLVHAGNRNVKDYVGLELTLLVDEDTKYMQWTEEGSVPASLAEVMVDDYVNVHGKVLEGVYTAKRITIDVPVYCLTSAE